MIQFLQDRQFMFDRIKQGIDIHPSDVDLKEFQKIAKEIDPDRHFTIYGCQSCVNELVKFVYDNQETKIKKETFPKQSREK